MRRPGRGVRDRRGVGRPCAAAGAGSPRAAQTESDDADEHDDEPGGAERAGDARGDQLASSGSESAAWKSPTRVPSRRDDRAPRARGTRLPPSVDVAKPAGAVVGSLGGRVAGGVLRAGRRSSRCVRPAGDRDEQDRVRSPAAGPCGLQVACATPRRATSSRPSAAHRGRVRLRLAQQRAVDLGGQAAQSGDVGEDAQRRDRDGEHEVIATATRPLAESRRLRADTVSGTAHGLDDRGLAGRGRACGAGS